MSPNISNKEMTYENTRDGEEESEKENKRTWTLLEMCYFSMEFELCMADMYSALRPKHSFIHCGEIFQIHINSYILQQQQQHTTSKDEIQDKKIITQNRSSFRFAQCNFLEFDSILSTCTDRSSERSLETNIEQNIYCACCGYVRVCERTYVCSFM